MKGRWKSGGVAGWSVNLGRRNKLALSDQMANSITCQKKCERRPRDLCPPGRLSTLPGSRTENPGQVGARGDLSCGARDSRPDPFEARTGVSIGFLFRTRSACWWRKCCNSVLDLFGSENRIGTGASNLSTLRRSNHETSEKRSCKGKR